MALFNVERYMGEDVPVNNTDKAAQLLENLKEQARLRKEKLTSVKSNENSSDLKEQARLRKEKLTSVKSNESSSERKKRKRQHKDSHDSETDIVQAEYASDSIEISDRLINEMEIESTSSKSDKSKKKRKLKKSEVSKIQVEEHEVKVPKVNNEDISLENTLDNSLETSLDKSTDNQIKHKGVAFPIEDEMEDTAEDEVLEDRNERANVDTGFTVLGSFPKKKVEKVHRVLPEWLKKPSIITVDVRDTTDRVESMPGLQRDLVRKLLTNNITHFFPVQTQIIPVMLDSVTCGLNIGKGGLRPSDICVSAPTGSGKTLAFVLPILQSLTTRKVRHVRALVLLPVRDLALQVYKVFQSYASGTDIKVGLLVGQKLFSAEQKQLVKEGLQGYKTLVDVIVATPGRLVDHINQTEGLDLTHLRFLVIDEADKMMEHIKQDWLSLLESAVYKDIKRRPRPGPLTPHSSISPQIPLQKLLFSATLSQNPEKLQQLNLFHPKLFTSVVKSQERKSQGRITPGDSRDADQTNEHEDDVEDQQKEGEFIGKFTTPQGLSEYIVECKAASKPLIVLHFLHNLHFTNILCFTQSVESSHRLFHLIRLMGGKEVQEFSSRLHSSQRTKILKKFAAGKIDIIVCSDAMARGMDIENVKYVISYDPPHVINNYIHRVGRTARAGKSGTAVTLLEKKQFHHFKKITREAGKTNIKELPVNKESINKLIPAFEKSLLELQEVLKSEKLLKKNHR